MTGYGDIGWGIGVIYITAAEVEVEDYTTGLILTALGKLITKLFNRLCLNDYLKLDLIFVLKPELLGIEVAEPFCISEFALLWEEPKIN